MLRQNMEFKPDLDHLFKVPDMWVCDALIYWDPETRECATRYTYTQNHPCVKGHFPGNPVMMGIMQWMGVSDACFCIAKMLKETGKIGQYTLSGNATILKDNGQIVCDIKGFVVEIFMGILLIELSKGTTDFSAARPMRYLVHDMVQ